MKGEPTLASTGERVEAADRVVSTEVRRLLVKYDHPTARSEMVVELLLERAELFAANAGNV